MNLTVIERNQEQAVKTIKPADLPTWYLTIKPRSGADVLAVVCGMKVKDVTDLDQQLPNSKVTLKHEGDYTKPNYHAPQPHYMPSNIPNIRWNVCDFYVDSTWRAWILDYTNKLLDPRYQIETQIQGLTIASGVTSYPQLNEAE